MSSVPMPRDLSEEAVAEWLHNIAAGSNPGMQVALRARAVRALVEREVAKERASTREKVREAVRETIRVLDEIDLCDEDERCIVSRVMGDHPSNASGGRDEGRPARGEAPRG